MLKLWYIVTERRNKTFKETVDQMTQQQLKQIQSELADVFACDPSELTGQTLGECLQSADKAPVIIYWGLYSDEDLALVF